MRRPQSAVQTAIGVLDVTPGSWNSGSSECRERRGPTGRHPDVAPPRRRSLERVETSSAGYHFQWKSWIIAGPMMTMKSTGRKKTIIGTVSLGGSAAAFFSASAMRASRLSWERTRIA